MARGLLKRFLGNQSGAVAATYAIALPALIVVGGVGFDYGRMVAMDSELQNAADQAALAAVTQLDGEAGARAEAVEAARDWLVNSTLMSDTQGNITVTAENVIFWQDREKVTLADSDANARFVEVRVDPRGLTYMLTPLGGAVGPDLAAQAMAGMGSSVCKVPPLMICSPDPTVPFNADGRVGQGIVATGHAPGNNTANGQEGTAGGASNFNWSPGNFGFLQVNDPDANNRNAALLRALAYVNPPIDCVAVEENNVSTGNPQNLYDAINTRFDIYDFPSNAGGGGNVLAPCRSGVCPPAPNAKKDFTNVANNLTGQNACKIHNQGWRLPASGSEFRPVSQGAYNPATLLNGNTSAAAMAAPMGLPRDNCHYTSYSGSGLCGGATGRFGSSEWARQDYFTKNHPGGRPSNWQTITRYETYLWELANALPTGGSPICATAGDPNRRVLTVAVVSNCAALSGSSTAVEIDEFVDVFLVEPSIDDSRRHNNFTNAVYMEVIGKSRIAGAGTYETQAIRRDVPYLIR